MSLHMLDKDGWEAAEHHGDFDLAPAMMTAVEALSLALYEAGLVAPSGEMSHIIDHYLVMADRTEGSLTNLYAIWARGLPENVRWLIGFIRGAKCEIDHRFGYSPEGADAMDRICNRATECQKQIALPEDPFSEQRMIKFGPPFIVDRQVDRDMKDAHDKSYMNEVRTDEDFIELARFDYAERKAGLTTWTNRETPEWMVPF